VTALSSVGAPVGAGGWGVNARANHVPLANRMTELTYAERREQYAERGGGVVAAGGLHSSTLELSVGATSRPDLLKPRVYLLKNYDPVGPSVSLSAGCLLWRVLIGQTDFDTMTSILDRILSLRST